MVMDNKELITTIERLEEPYVIMGNKTFTRSNQEPHWFCETRHEPEVTYGFRNHIDFVKQDMNQ